MELSIEDLQKPTSFRQECIILKDSHKIFIDIRAVAKKSQHIKNILEARYEEIKLDRNKLLEPYYLNVGSINSWRIFISWIEYGFALNCSDIVDFMLLCDYLLLGNIIQLFNQYRPKTLADCVFSEYMEKYEIEELMSDKVYNDIKYVNKIHIKNYVLDRYLLQDIHPEERPSATRLYTIDGRLEAYGDTIFRFAERFGINREELLAIMREHEKEEKEEWDILD